MAPRNANLLIQWIKAEILLNDAYTQRDLSITESIDAADYAS